MAKELLTVRDVDEKVLRRFKATAVGKGLKMGTALTQAMDTWIESEENGKKLNPRNFLKLEGLIKTRKRVYWSEEVDEALYGSKK